MINLPPGPNVLGRLLLNVSKPPANIYFGLAGLLLQRISQAWLSLLARGKLGSSATQFCWLVSS